MTELISSRADDAHEKARAACTSASFPNKHGIFAAPNIAPSADEVNADVGLFDNSDVAAESAADPNNGSAAGGPDAVTADPSIGAELTFQEVWTLGYHRLCSIVPPNAELSEGSSLYKRMKKNPDHDGRGKAPGLRGRDGKWYSYNFVNHESTTADIAEWQGWGGNIGVKTGGGTCLIDADAPREEDAQIIRDAIKEVLGFLPPVRVGRAPKAGYLVRVNLDKDESGKPKELVYQRVEFGQRDAKGRLQDRVEKALRAWRDAAPAAVLRDAPAQGGRT